MNCILLDIRPVHILIDMIHLSRSPEQILRQSGTSWFPNRVVSHIPKPRPRVGHRHCPSCWPGQSTRLSSFSSFRIHRPPQNRRVGDRKTSLLHHQSPARSPRRLIQVVLRQIVQNHPSNPGNALGRRIGSLAPIREPFFNKIAVGVSGGGTTKPGDSLDKLFGDK